MTREQFVNYIFRKYTMSELWNKIIKLDSSYTFKNLGNMDKQSLIDLYIELKGEKKNEAINC